jgi:hypothetical protein
MLRFQDYHDNLVHLYSRSDLFQCLAMKNSIIAYRPAQYRVSLVYVYTYVYAAENQEHHLRTNIFNTITEAPLCG